MSTYEPGTVAVATVRGVEGVRVMRGGGDNEEPFWWTPEYVGDILGNAPQWRSHPDRDVTDVRPLVVLDPEDLNVKRFLVLHNPPVSGCNSEAAESLATLIREAVKPPRIPEPGLWGVVEASPRTGSPAMRRWVRYGTGWRDAFGGLARWDELLNPTLIREGVES